MSAKVDILETLTLCAGLKAALEAIAHPTADGEKLFGAVLYHEDTNLAEALQDLVVMKQSVCIIVPQGDRYEQRKEGRSLVSTRLTNVDLVIADRAYTKGGQDAAFGGPKNVGVLKMKDLVVAALAENPQLGGLRFCALFPTEGAMLEISADDAKRTPGRQAFVQNYETPSGEIITPLTMPWLPN